MNELIKTWDSVVGHQGYFALFKINNNRVHQQKINIILIIIYRCDQCPKISNSITAMQKHKLRHVPKEQRVYKCNDCSKEFNSKEALKSHTKSHIPINERRIYDCEFCDLK